MLLIKFVWAVLCCFTRFQLTEQSENYCHASSCISEEKESTAARTEKFKAHDFSDLFSKDWLRNILPHIKDSSCRNQLLQAVQDLDQMKLWAFQMLDSTGRISSHLLSGNSHQLGDYDQCLHIRHPHIRPQYCLGLIDVNAEPSASTDVKLVVERVRGNNFIQSHRSNPGHFIPTYTTLKWGLCVPESCSPSSLSQALDVHFNVTLPSSVTVQTKIDPKYCKHGGPLQSTAWPLSTYLAILLFATLLVISLLSTYFDQSDIPLNKLSKSEGLQVLCSLKRNWAQFFLIKKEDIGCIHGLRTVATFMLFFAHNTIPLNNIPFINRTELTEIMFAPFGSLFRSSIVYTDTFLLLSGLLSSYYLQTTSSIPARFGNRLLRMIPAHLAVVIFTANVLPYLNSGPLWSYIVENNARLCVQGWWKNLLFIHNFFPFEQMCAPHTHHLALDVQLFVLAIPLVIGLKSRPTLTSFIILGLNLGSAMLRYVTAKAHHLSLVIYTGANLEDLYRSADLSYIQPLHRASPYLSGVWLGFLLHQIKFHPIKMNKTTLYIGWSLTTLCLSYCLMANYHVGYINYRYDVTEAANYAGLSSLMTSVALSWVILACSTGYGGFVNSFLSSRAMCLLSKMSFSIYLVQFCVSLEELLLVIFTSFVLTLLVDLPVQNLKALTLR
ncbi:hypothetical protein M8J75_000855 [Diaphorina citri]|nr:hypothetical protein M8J75_000855 [Diaphorina citri]